MLLLFPSQETGRQSEIQSHVPIPSDPLNLH